MNYKEIENMWSKFAEQHEIDLQENDQYFLIIANKKQTYTVSEKIDSLNIYYRYTLYKMDYVNASNFIISIPVDSDSSFKISRSNFIERLFTKENIKVKASDNFALDNENEAKLTANFEQFFDLIIQLDYPEAKDHIKNYNETKVLELSTKVLPTKLEYLENLRKLLIDIYNHLLTEKVINNTKSITNA